MRKRLIINADDFGIHRAVNQAVIKAHKEGILTSTSLMAGGVAFEEAVNLAKATPTLGIGVHLTLVGQIQTVLEPQSVPSLTWDDGLLCKDYIELIKRDIQGRITLQEVYNEWDAQIKKICASGISVTHLDGHQHMHMWPHFFPIALELAHKYHITCMRVPDESFLFGITEGQWFRWCAKNGLSLLARKNRNRLDKEGIITNDHFFGMLYGGNLTESNLDICLNKLGQGVNEIMCHPSISEDDMDATFHWGYHGEKELRGLLSEHSKSIIKEKQIDLISYKDVKI